MKEGSKPMPEQKDDLDFTQQAEQDQHGIFLEYFRWLHHNNKWWLLPIISTLLIVGVFVMLSTTAVAPFIYALF